MPYETGKKGHVACSVIEKYIDRKCKDCGKNMALVEVVEAVGNWGAGSRGVFCPHCVPWKEAPN